MSTVRSQDMKAIRRWRASRNTNWQLLRLRTYKAHVNKAKELRKKGRAKLQKNCYAVVRNKRAREHAGEAEPGGGGGGAACSWQGRGAGWTEATPWWPSC